MADDKPELSELAETLGGLPATSEESEESPGERKLREDREAFDRLTKGEEEEAPKKEKPKAKRKKKEPAPEVEAKEETPEPVQESTEARKAKEFLRLKQTAPAHVLDALSPEEAIDWHSQVARREVEIDGVYRELAELRKQRDEQTTEETEPSSAVPAVELDPEPIAARLKETLGEEESGAFASVLADAVKSAVSPYAEALKEAKEELAEVKGFINGAQEQNTRTISRSNQERLAEFIPQLSNRETWATVEREVVYELGRNDATYTTSEEAFDAAVLRMYGSDSLDVTPTEEDDVDEETARIQASQPTDPVKKKKPRKLTPEEQQWKIFKHLESHDGDVRGARRAAEMV